MTIQQTECVLLSSLMDEPTNRPGPVACTAIAYAEWWESPEAQQVALAVREVMRKGRPLHRVVVRQHLPKDCQDWVDHPMFNDGLPMSCVDSYCSHILTHYENKRLVALLGEAYASAMAKPTEAHKIALELRVKLEAIL